MKKEEVLRVLEDKVRECNWIIRQKQKKDNWKIIAEELKEALIVAISDLKAYEKLKGRIDVEKIVAIFSEIKIEGQKKYGKGQHYLMKTLFNPEELRNIIQALINYLEGGKG